VGVLLDIKSAEARALAEKVAAATSTPPGGPAMPKAVPATDRSWR
jgi:hypothetical protein